jgi:hypothetical protein
MGSDAGGNSVEQRKRRAGSSGPVSGGASRGGDVFDQLGNAGITAHMQSNEVEAEAPSMLSLADASSVSRGDLERAAAEEEAARRAVGSLEVQESTEEAAAMAAGTGVDPVLLTDPRDLGSSEKDKREALGAEGESAVGRAIDEAAVALGAVKLDDAAREAVGERIRGSLEVGDIVRARREGRVDELVRDALRNDAIRSRDEVEFLLQQLSQDERQLGEIVASGDPDAIAVELIEHLAVELVEIEDLYALAAYDHGDILKKIVLGDEALQVSRRLSPLALRMGGFAAVAYQMVVDELGRHPLPVDPVVGASGGEAGPVRRGDPRLPAFRSSLLALVTDLRLFRTASAA